MPKNSNTVPLSLGLTKHRKGVKSIPNSPLNLAGYFRTGAGSLRYTGMLANRTLAVYQHQYLVFIGTTVIPVIHSVYLVEISPHWPSVKITKRSQLAWLGRVLGKTPGLQLDDPQFNRTFNVKTDNENFAIAMLTPELQQFLLSKPSVTWRIGLGRVALIYSGKLKEKRIAASLQRLENFLQLLPEELEAWQ